MYVYINALNCFDEVHLGYVIDWDNSDQNDTTDNEIDVVAIKNSVPYFISCKMRKSSENEQKDFLVNKNKEEVTGIVGIS